MNFSKHCRSPWLWALSYLAITLALSYHGFSLGYWQDLVNPPSKVNLIGESQGVRSDDFFVGLPLAFSQIASDFKSTNPLLGFGQSNLVTSYQIPVKHWTALFKPLTWGYFIGRDFGMSWHWNLNFILLFMSTFLFLKNFSAFDSKTVFWLAVGTSFSSFFQFWSYIGAPYFYWPLLMVILLKLFTYNSSGKFKFLLGLLFIWSLGNFTFTIYPPFQIFGAYFVLIYSLFFLIQSNQKKNLLMLYSAALITILLLLFQWFTETHETINAVRATVYPGQRFTLGGEGLGIQFFQNNLFLKEAFKVSPILGGNVSEGSGFWSVFIPLIVIILSQWNIQKRREKILILISLFFLSVFIFWYFLGLPQLVALLSGLALSVEKRSVIFIAFFNLISLAIYSKISATPPKNGLINFSYFLWFVFQGFFLLTNCPSDQGAIAGAVIMSSFHLSSIWFLFKGNALRFAKIWGLAMFLSTFTFNPIVLGGYDKLFVKSELANALIKTDPSRNHTWLVDNDVVTSALPRILGLKSFGGPTFYPQRDFWAIIDEDSESEHIWNRYAALVLKLVDSKKTQINLVYNDRVEVGIPKDSEILSKIGINRILQLKSNPTNTVPTNFNKLGETTCCTIWGRD